MKSIREIQVIQCGHTPEGYRITVAADAMGPQIILQSEDKTVHLLSQSFSSVTTATAVAAEVGRIGPKAYKDFWIDMTKMTEVADALMLMFCGYVPEKAKVYFND